MKLQTLTNSDIHVNNYVKSMFIQINKWKNGTQN